MSQYQYPINTYERETKELLTVNVQKNKVPLVSNIFLSVIDSDLRPVLGDWKPALITDTNQCGILIDTLPVGTYSVWVRVIDLPEDAVFRAGTVRIV